MRKKLIPYKINNTYELEKKREILRAEVYRLYNEEGISTRDICKRLKMSRNFVMNWIHAHDKAFSTDHRGWPKGKRRKWNSMTEERIRSIHNYISDPQNGHYYHGATAIQQEWRKRHDDPPPPLRTIGMILKDLGLSKSRKKRSTKGASRYLCYPGHTIHHYDWTRVMEIDFIGKKFISGQTDPINFAACCFKHPPKVKYFKRIKGETGEELQRFLEPVFIKFERPDVVKMDNGFAMAGTGPVKGALSKLPIWLLSQQIYPMYAVPRKPFTQASIEGNNSVFSKKFWYRHTFTTVGQIDRKLETFNEASINYHEYNSPSSKRKARRNFVPKIFYLRQVMEDEKGRGYIEIANGRIRIRKTFINYYLFIEWNLEDEKVYAYIEKEKELEMVKIQNFKLNSKTKERLNRSIK